VGTDPEIVLTTPDYATAVVFERGDDSVTVVDAESLAKVTTPVRENLNDMVMSPDGGWVVLWHDLAHEKPDDPPADGLQSFNEVSFVGVPSGEHFPMAVGFNPKMVRFTPDGHTAVVVSDGYLAKVDLTQTPLLPQLIELEPGVLDPPSAEEVIVAADGSFAWVRQFGATDLLVVDLASAAVLPVPAGDNPTDLDLSPDGQEAVAVARGSRELWVYDARDPFAAPDVLALPVDSEYGSLLFDPTGDQAILYTTASLVERFAVWDRTTGAITERPLVKPVQSMAVTPTGGSLEVFHTLADGPDTEPVFAGSWALTLIDLADFRSNPLLLPAEPLAYANSTTGELGYFVMKDSTYFEVLNYVTLLHDQYTIASVPSFLGVLPDFAPADGDEPPAWVSQEYPLGRISFFDPDTTEMDTLTGFELNSGIEEEQ
jgi:DNA-binding beta-propeller fold protein YncE